MTGSPRVRSIYGTVPPLSAIVKPNRSPLAGAVGARLRALRKAQGISAAELARRARVGKATLSELEAGQRNPTLETLYALTKALGAPLSAALPVDDAPLDGGDAVHGAAVDAALVERFVDVGVTTELYRVAIRAGRRQVSAPHATGVTEHLVVFAGEALVGRAANPVQVRAGASATWAADVEHVYAGVGDVDVAAALLMRHPSA